MYRSSDSSLQSNEWKTRPDLDVKEEAIQALVRKNKRECEL